MLFNRKPLQIIFLLNLVFFSTNIFAQHAGMSAVYNSMSRQYSSQRMQTQLRDANGLYRGGSEIQNLKYSFQVKFKDSSVKVISSQIYEDTIRHKNYLLSVDKNFSKSDSLHRFVKVYPEQTVYILRDKSRGNGNDHEFVIGLPTDSCWMFNVKPNHISIYSYLSEDYKFSAETIISIQLDNGPIVKFDESNLIKLVGDDVDALNTIHSKKYLEAIKIYNKDVDKSIKENQKKHKTS